MNKQFKNMIKKAEQSVDYWAEFTVIEFTEELSRVIKEKNITRSELAKRINSSPAYITKVLNGNENLTIKSMAKLSMAVGMLVHVHIAPKNTVVRWSHNPSSEG